MSPWQIRTVSRLSEIGREAWDTLVGAESPFLEWDWLSVLEETGCVTPDRGWAPQHLLVEEDGRLIGACPVYLKGNSEGEFVFDHEIAHAADAAGLAYYPKLLVAVPYTPAGGLRFLTAHDRSPAHLIRVMGEALMSWCEEHGLSSVHVNFCRPEEAQVLRSLGFLERKGLQYHWENRGYRDFEDYLSAFRSKRRTQIRRERREMTDQGITLRVLTGTEIKDELAPILYRLYKGHIDRLYWGRPYLTPAFFEAILPRFRRHLCVVLAEQNGEVIAGTFNVQKHGVFYGRYWGAFRDVRHLHFNVCYYAAVEHCIARGIQRFEPGAGGDFKQLRGFDPRPTLSMHHFRHAGLHEAVASFFDKERQRITRIMDHLNLHSQLKPEDRRGNGNP